LKNVFDTDYIAMQYGEGYLTSQIPQILAGIGVKYTYMYTMMDYTTWTIPTADENLVWWLGIDGTKIMSIPRYSNWKTAPLSYGQGCNNMDELVEWNDRCKVNDRIKPLLWFYPDYVFGDARNGITLPIAPAWLQYVTMREYCAKFEPPTETVGPFNQDQLLELDSCWGSDCGRNMLACADSERRVLTAEKWAALSTFFSGRKYPLSDLDDAWKNTLVAQHHDIQVGVFITWADPQMYKYLGLDVRHFANVPVCKYVPGTGTPYTERIPTDERYTTLAQIEKTNPPFSDYAVAMNEKVRELTSGIMNDSLTGLAEKINTDTFFDKTGCVPVVVFNSVQTYNNGMCTVRFSHDPGKESVQVVDKNNEPVVSQSTHDTVSFYADNVAGTGYKTYYVRKEPVGTAAMESNVKLSTVTEDNGVLTIETDLYITKFDKQRGGCITSLVLKQTGKELVAKKKLMNEFTAFDQVIRKEIVSGKSPAQKIVVEENSPIRTVVAVIGRFNKSGYTARTIFVKNTARIEFETEFDFDNEWLGPDDVTQNFEPTIGGYVMAVWRTHEKKLRVHFPVGKGYVVTRKTPYETLETKSAGSDKYHVLLDWVQMKDKTGTPVVIMTDRTTGFNYTKDDLSVVLAYGGHGACTSHTKIMQKLVGKHVFRYAVCHGSRNNVVKDSELCFAKWLCPMVPVISTFHAGTLPTQSGLVSFDSKDANISSVYSNGTDLFLRAIANDKTRVIFNVPDKAAKIVPVNLADEETGSVGVEGTNTVAFDMNKLELKTIKIVK
jgi:alpha-mannosidase